MTPVTQWFDIKNEPPVNPGVYRVLPKKCAGEVDMRWAKWDGGEWMLSSFWFCNAENEESESFSCYNGEFTHWRGLTEKSA